MLKQDVQGDRKLLFEAPVVGESREAEFGPPSLVVAHKATEHKTDGSESRFSAGWTVLPQRHGSYSEIGEEKEEEKEGGRRRTGCRGNEQHLNLLTRTSVFSDLNLN